MVVLLFEDGGADCGEVIFGVGVVAVSGLAGPEGVFVELKEFFVGGTVFATAEDHGAETTVANGKGVDPLAGRLFVPEG